MKFLALERPLPGHTQAEYAPRLKAEAARAWELHQAGIIRELYFRGDRAEAVLILECDSPDQCRSVLNTLPLVRAGLIDFEVVPLVPYPGFARLFGGS